MHKKRGIAVIDNRIQYKELKHKDFLEELFLEQERVYFYVEANDKVLSNPLHWVYKQESIHSFTCLDDIISRVERKSEKCEIIGYDAYYESLQYEILSCPHRIRWNVLIRLDEALVNVAIRLKYVSEEQLFIGYYTLQVDSEQTVLFANSYKDSLTGLFNRNTLNLHLSKLHHGENVYAVMIDIDYFKSINDTYGHEAGDEVLSKLGETFINLADENVIFYRIGGDEFFAQVHASKEELRVLLTHIQEKVREVQVHERMITCSMGAACYDESCQSHESLLKLCDLAMYKAKSAGRNQFHIL